MGMLSREKVASRSAKSTETSELTVSQTVGEAACAENLFQKNGFKRLAGFDTLITGAPLNDDGGGGGGGGPGTVGD